MEHKLITEAVKGILAESQNPVATEKILYSALAKMEEKAISDGKEMAELSAKELDELWEFVIKA